MTQPDRTVQADDHLAPGAPFRVGDRIAFFPAEIGPTSMWIRMGFAVIDDIDEEAESIGFHFESDPDVRAAQGMENIVRRSAAYNAWRSAWEEAFAQSRDEDEADRGTEELPLLVPEEHPMHGRNFEGGRVP